MKRDFLVILTIAIVSCVFFSCSKDEEDPLAHLNNVMSESFSINDLYNICHYTTWAEMGAAIESRGYYGSSGSLNREWNKTTNYQCLKYWDTDSLLVSFVINAATWGSFSGHITWSVFNINDKIATKLINTKIAELKGHLENKEIEKIRVKVGSSSSDYYTWEAATQAFLSSYNPSHDNHGYSCRISILTDAHIYYIATKSKGDRDLGRGFDVGYGVGNRNEM